MSSNNPWELGFCGGEQIMGESSKNCFMTPYGVPMCRCPFAKKRNYELCYKLVLAVNQEQLHMATR